MTSKTKFTWQEGYEVYIDENLALSPDGHPLISLDGLG
jgi:hypothetical protein